jgi:hypothetical protein
MDQRIRGVGRDHGGIGDSAACSRPVAVVMAGRSPWSILPKSTLKAGAGKERRSQGLVAITPWMPAGSVRARNKTSSPPVL